jgi:hypothetical protein
MVDPSSPSTALRRVSPAWRDRPYYKPVGNYSPGYAGYPAATADQVREAIDWAYQNDIQIITRSSEER